MKNIGNWRILTTGGKLILFAVLLFGCNAEPQLWDVDSRQQVISEYV